MRCLQGLLAIAVLGMAALMGCTESKQAEPDLEWPPDATAYFDEYGILSADCATDEDCAMVLGYYHAADRFVQMDLRRRNFTGRLTDFADKNVAKIFGIPGLDVLNRAVYSTRDGLPAEQSLYEQASPEVIAVLKAYSAGVNQWIDDVRNGNNGAVLPASSMPRYSSTPRTTSLNGPRKTAWQSSSGIRVAGTKRPSKLRPAWRDPRSMTTPSSPISGAVNR